MPRKPLELVLASAVWLGAALAAPGSAMADDEGSEHTATLVGAERDTLGVVLHHDAKDGWSMDFRAQPGADTQRVALRFLPADHAHYAVVVSPGRGHLTFVLQSRPELNARTPAVWITDGGGAVLKAWRLGALVDTKTLANLSRSISHTYWLDAQPTIVDGVVRLSASGASIAIDPSTRALRR